MLAAADPMASAMWLACLQAALARCDGDLAAVRALGQDAFTAQVRAELALCHNRVYAARHAELTGRAKNPLTDQQARAAIAAALIRRIHAIITPPHALGRRHRRRAPPPRPGGDRPGRMTTAGAHLRSGAKLASPSGQTRF